MVSPLILRINGPPLPRTNGKGHGFAGSGGPDLGLAM
jgi:hypothetical protein